MVRIITTTGKMLLSWTRPVHPTKERSLTADGNESGRVQYREHQRQVPGVLGDLRLPAWPSSSGLQRGITTVSS